LGNPLPWKSFCRTRRKRNSEHEHLIATQCSLRCAWIRLRDGCWLQLLLPILEFKN
jgi:hypothetical protein